MTEVTLRQLEYFAAIAATGSVTEAAKRCHVTQTAVSLGLAQLEQAVGATLAIRRRGRGLSLTAEGQAVATRARLVAEQVADLSSAVDEVHGELSGRLVIGIFRTLSVHAIAPLVDWFATRHPGVELDFVEGPASEIQEAMLAGRVQVCVLYQAQLSTECSAELIAPARRQVVTSPDHPLARLESIEFADLAGHRAILLGEDPALTRTLAEFELAGVEPTVMWKSASVPAIHNVVGRGLAYSLLMQPVPRSPEGDPLVFTPLTTGGAGNPVIAARPTGVSPSALAEETITALRRYWNALGA